MLHLAETLQKTANNQNLRNKSALTPPKDLEGEEPENRGETARIENSGKLE
jgi:hypothetical protein